MSLRSDWNSAKNQLKAVGVDTKVFNQDLGPALDAFESARKKEDAARGDAAIQKAITARKAAAAKAAGILGKYGNTVKYLAAKATDDRQRSVLENVEALALKMKVGLDRNK